MGRGGGHDLQPGDVGVEGLEGLGMLAGQVLGRPVGAAEHDRHLQLPARHVQHLGGVVQDLVEGLGREVEGHPLHDGPQAHQGRANAHPGEALFRDRGVDDPPGAVLIQQALADLVGAVVLGHLLPQQDHRVVPGQLLVHRVMQGLAKGDYRHSTSSYRVSGEGSGLSSAKRAASSLACLHSWSMAWNSSSDRTPVSCIRFFRIRIGSWLL